MTIIDGIFTSNTYDSVISGIPTVQQIFTRLPGFCGPRSNHMSLQMSIRKLNLLNMADHGLSGILCSYRNFGNLIARLPKQETVKFVPDLKPDPRP